MFQRVVIWGYPLNSHTHSYVHYGWYKGFKSLGYETHWLPNEPVKDASLFKNCLFITEGYTDDHIPMDASNIYLVHVAIKPKKYLDIGARLIDLRYNVTEIKDCNYIYQLANKSLQKISEVTYYEKHSSDRDLNPRWRHHTAVQYEAIYIAWATDLLPDEIHFEDRFIEPAKPSVTYFIGSIGGGNQMDVQRFATSCSRHGIQFIHHNPWQNPLSFNDAKQLVQQSIVCPDIRGSGDPDKVRMGETGTCHKHIGYIPCRLFKNISYGKLGMTNCPRLKELFGDKVLLETDESQMVPRYLEASQNKDYILEQMKWVKEHHTYLNRIQDLLTILDDSLHP